MVIINTYRANFGYALNEFENLVAFNKGRGGQYKYAYMKILKSGNYQIGLLKEKPKNPNSYQRIVELTNEREKRINKLILKMQISAFQPIKDPVFAKKLMNERMTDKMLSSELWNYLVTDNKSGKLFRKSEIDPTYVVVFVDINFLRSRKGNKIFQDELNGGIGKSVNNILKLFNSDMKLPPPIFDLKDDKVVEGNHRVEAVYQLGFKSCPVFLTGGW